MKYRRSLFQFSSKRARAYLIRISGDVLLDVYNGRHVTKFDAEHVFPLKSAWEQGFAKMYVENPTEARLKMKCFANDQRNLAVAGPGSNRSRGHKTLWNWVPLNLAWIPTRNAIVRELATDYGLTLTKPQIWAMDWADKKLRIRHKHGIHMGKVRAWLLQRGFHRALFPF